MLIRAATHADAPAIARVHVATWRDAYRGLIPDDYLANLSYETRAAFWAQVISNPFTPAVVHVAEIATTDPFIPTFVHTAIEAEIADDGKVVGFVYGGPTRTEMAGYNGELYAIYVLPEAQGMGLGRRLAHACAQTLYERGINNMMLWALKDNAPSRAFYESLGGQLLEEKQEQMGEITLTEVAYGWPDITLLLNR